METRRERESRASCRPRKLRWIAGTVLALGLTLQASAVRSADVHDILVRMRKAVEPGKDMRATAVFTIANERGETVKWTGQMYRRGGAAPRTRLVFDDPIDLRGTEVSVAQAADGTTKTRLYLPALRRARVLDADTRGESFLGTDFNYEDLGFQQLDTQQLRLDESKDPGCYHVESVPGSGWWYGRVDRCIDKKDYLPRRTEYYDRSGVLWKVRTLGAIKKIDGYPTATEIKMETIPAHTSTTITLSDVHYDTYLTPPIKTATEPDCVGCTVTDASDDILSIRLSRLSSSSLGETPALTGSDCKVQIGNVLRHRVDRAHVGLKSFHRRCLELVEAAS